MYFGITTASAIPDTGAYFTGKDYVHGNLVGEIGFVDGKKIGCGSTSWNAYTGGRIQSGVEITVRQHGAHNYGLVINDKDCGIAFKNMSKANVFYIQFYQWEGSVTVLQVTIYI